jgi:hypothetical protein
MAGVNFGNNEDFSGILQQLLSSYLGGNMMGDNVDYGQGYEGGQMPLGDFNQQSSLLNSILGNSGLGDTSGLSSNLGGMLGGGSELGGMLGGGMQSGGSDDIMNFIMSLLGNQYRG